MKVPNLTFSIYRLVGKYQEVILLSRLFFFAGINKHCVSDLCVMCNQKVDASPPPTDERAEKRENPG